MATGNAIVKYNGTSLESWGPLEDLTGAPVWDVTLDSQERVWFATASGGVGVLLNDKIVQYGTEVGLSSNAVYSVHVDADDNLWSGPLEGTGLSRCHISAEATLEDCRVFGPNEGIALDPVGAIVEQDDGTLWFGTRGSGVYSYREGTFSQYSAESSGLAGDDVYALDLTGRGELAVGCRGAGASFCRLSEGFACRSVLFENGLSSDYILGILEDREGSTWIASWDGLDKIRTERFRIRGLEHGMLADKVLGTHADPNGDIWAASLSGLTRVRNTTGILGDDEIRTWSSEDGLPSDEVWDILRDQAGRLWVATSSGLCLFDEEEGCRLFTEEESGLTHYVLELFETANGDLWIGTTQGASRLRMPVDGGEPDILSLTEDEGLSGNLVYSIEQDDSGTVWIGYVGGGLDAFDGEQVIRYTNTPGMVPQGVLSLYNDGSGNIWIGSFGGGLLSFRPAEQPVEFKRYGPETGIEVSEIVVIHGAGEGRLWLGPEPGSTSLIQRPIKAMARWFGRWIGPVVWTGIRYRQTVLLSTRVDTVGLGPNRASSS